MTARRKTLFIANIAWDFVWQRHQSLASLFARDSDVVFCEIPGMKRVRVRDFARVLARLRVMRAARAGEAQGGTGSETRVPAGVEIVRPFVLPATNAAFRAFNARRIRELVERRADLRAGVDVILNYSPTVTARMVVHRIDVDLQVREARTQRQIGVGRVRREPALAGQVVADQDDMIDRGGGGLLGVHDGPSRMQYIKPGGF